MGTETVFSIRDPLPSQIWPIFSRCFVPFVLCHLFCAILWVRVISVKVHIFGEKKLWHKTQLGQICEGNGLGNAVSLKHVFKLKRVLYENTALTILVLLQI